MSRVDKMGSGADSIVPLPLDMPVFSPIIYLLVRCEIDIPHLQHHLQAYIPDLALQIHENEVLILTLVVEPLRPCALFEWSERARFSDD